MIITKHNKRSSNPTFKATFTTEEIMSGDFEGQILKMKESLGMKEVNVKCGKVDAKKFATIMRRINKLRNMGLTVAHEIDCTELPCGDFEIGTIKLWYNSVT